MAVLFSYGCPPVTMGPKFLGLSPDFPGPARELIESATGAVSIFLQGAGGDINPVTGIGPTEDDTENMTRLGQSLGAEVVRVMSEIRTSSVRGQRVIFASLTKNSMYPYVPVPDSPIQISAVGEAAHLPLLPFPSLEDARGIQSFCSDRLEKAIQSSLPPHQLAFHYRFRDWSNCLLRAVESGKKQTSISVNLQAIRLGDVAVASAAGETLSELGLRVKAASPFADTRFLGYSNGMRRLYTQRRMLSGGRMVALGNVSRARYALPSLYDADALRADGSAAFSRSLRFVAEGLGVIGLPGNSPLPDSVLL